MGVSVYDYVSSEASSSTTGGWNTAEGQDPSTVNDGNRAHKQNVANYLKDQGGTITTGGSANVQTATLNQPIATTVPTNFRFTVKFGFTNTGAATLNLNSIGAKSVKVMTSGSLADPLPGDMLAGRYGEFAYDGTYLVLLNPASSTRAANVQTKTSGFTIDGSHFGKTIVATSGTFTIALTAAATLGDGFWFDVRNEGTGCVTIDPNSSETINGQTTLAFFQNGGRVICDGSNWRIIGLSQKELIAVNTASSSATLDFSIPNASNYRSYEIGGDTIIPGTNATYLIMRVSVGGVFQTTAGYYYRSVFRWTNSGSATEGDAPGGAATGMAIASSADTMGTGTDQVFNFRMWFGDISQTSAKKHFMWVDSSVPASAVELGMMHAGAFAGSNSALDGIRFFQSSGNIESGTFTLMANRKVF